MNNFNDLKNVWQQQSAPLPSVDEIIRQARKTRAKMIRINILLMLSLVITMPVMIFVLVHYKFEYATTKIGVVIAIIAVIGAMVLNTQMLGIMLNRANSSVSSRAFLEQMIRYRNKQRFFQTKGVTVYFILLSAGILMYLFEFLMADRTVGIIAITLTSAWILFNWFWIRPRTIRKNEKLVTSLIEQAEQLVQQLEEK